MYVHTVIMPLYCVCLILFAVQCTPVEDLAQVPLPRNVFRT